MKSHGTYVRETQYLDVVLYFGKEVDGQVLWDFVPKILYLAFFFRSRIDDQRIETEMTED